MRPLMLAGCLALLALLPLGCIGPRTLAPDGPYARLDAASPASAGRLTLGQQLVKVDQLITGAERVVDQFLAWELATRAQHGSASLREFAIRLSHQAPPALRSAVAVRDAYAIDPTPANHSRMEDAIRVLDALLLEVAHHRKP